MLLAFFIPSIQEQWDRYESRRVIEQYLAVGDELSEEGHFKTAEEVYAKAFELSDQKRLDIEVKRLTARVNRVNDDPSWESDAPEDLEESDFQLLLHLQKGKEKEKDRVSTLNSYGIYLASLGRTNESRAAFDEALLLDPDEVHTYINLGNLLDQQEKKPEAGQMYLRAISIQPGNTLAHYNLGLLYEEEGNLTDAEKEFQKAVELDPDDADAMKAYRMIRRKN